VFKYEPDCPLADLRRKLGCCFHDSILSRNGVSRKPGAIHYGLLNPISQVPAVRDALHQVAETLKKHLK
jgi:hypothetical protein